MDERRWPSIGKEINSYTYGRRKDNLQASDVMQKKMPEKDRTQLHNTQDRLQRLEIKKKETPVEIINKQKRMEKRRDISPRNLYKEFDTKKETLKESRRVVTKPIQSLFHQVVDISNTDKSRFLEDKVKRLEERMKKTTRKLERKMDQIIGLISQLIKKKA